MTYQTVFKRYELKYMLTSSQKLQILEAISPYMELDQYGRTTIRNIYYDTDSYRLIRHSIESPAYKEKLRVRSYKKAVPDSTVFVELKKSTSMSSTSAAFLCQKPKPLPGYQARSTAPWIPRSPGRSTTSWTITRPSIPPFFFLMKEKPITPKTTRISGSPLTTPFSAGRRIFPWNPKYTEHPCFRREWFSWKSNAPAECRCG